MSSDDTSDGKSYPASNPANTPEPTPQPEIDANTSILVDHFPEIAEAVRERYPVDGDAQPGVIAMIEDGEFIFCVRDHEDVRDLAVKLFPYDEEEQKSSWKSWRTKPENIERARKEGFMIVLSIFDDESSFSQLADPRNDPPDPIWERQRIRRLTAAGRHNLALHRKN